MRASVSEQAKSPVRVTTAPAGLPPPSHLILFIYSLSECVQQLSHSIPPPLLFFVTYFNNVIIKVIFIIFIINIPQVSGIPQVSSDTMQIMVWYVPVSVMGRMFAGMGMVWEIPTCSIPMPNPKYDGPFEII